MAGKTKTKTKKVNPYKKKVISYQKFYANQKKYPGYYTGLKYKEYVNTLVKEGKLSEKTGKRMLSPKKKVSEVDVKREQYTPAEVYKKSRTTKGRKELKRMYNKIVRSQRQRNKALKAAGFKQVEIKGLAGEIGSKEWRMGIVEAVRAYTSYDAEKKRAQAYFDRQRIAIAKSTGIVIETKAEMERYGEFMNKFKSLISQYIYDSDTVAEDYYNDYDSGKKSFEEIYRAYTDKLYEKGKINESERDKIYKRVSTENEIEKYRKKFEHYKHKSVRPPE